MIKKSNHKRCGLMMVQSFLEPSKPYVTNEEIIYTALFVKKKSAFAERNIRSLKTLSTSTLKKSGHTPT